MPEAPATIWLESALFVVDSSVLTPVYVGIENAGGTWVDQECVVDRGLVKPPFFVQSVFGILGGIGTHPEDVMMKGFEEANKLYATLAAEQLCVALVDITQLSQRRPAAG